MRREAAREATCEGDGFDGFDGFDGRAGMLGGLAKWACRPMHPHSDSTAAPTHRAFGPQWGVLTVAEFRALTLDPAQGAK